MDKERDNKDALDLLRDVARRSVAEQSPTEDVVGEAQSSNAVIKGTYKDLEEMEVDSKCPACTGSAVKVNLRSRGGQRG